MGSKTSLEWRPCTKRQNVGPSRKEKPRKNILCEQHWIDTGGEGYVEKWMSFSGDDDDDDEIKVL